MTFEIILHIENGTIERFTSKAATLEAATEEAAEHATWQGPYEQVTRTEIIPCEIFQAAR